MDSTIDSTSIDDESSSLLNDSVIDKRSELTSESNDDTEDTRSELKFDQYLESEEEKQKRSKIEEALKSKSSDLNTWRRLAIEEYGLVNDDLRKKVWPLLLEIDPNPTEIVPTLKELSIHEEYDQVVLDVNRSLKRFPPGIPYKQRVALQDQLTVLILRVIMKYPHLKYYQGYHDVAVTFLLVVGETLAFKIMERLSTDHLRECMEPTMEKTSYRLNYIYPILKKTDNKLYEFMESAMVGTMFALPWFLTWFGHSLNQYRDVVRLYDFFLASQPLMPLYVTTALVIERRDEVFEAGCDMASIHCQLSRIPDNLNFDEILNRASLLYKKYAPERIEKEVAARVQKEKEQRKQDELRMRRRLNRNATVWHKMKNYVPGWLFLHYKNKYGLLFATATILFGIYAYLKATETDITLFRTNIKSS